MSLMTSRRVGFVRVFFVAVGISMLVGGGLEARKSSGGLKATAAAGQPLTGRLKPAPPSALFTSSGWTSNAKGAIDPAVFNLALGAASCAVRSGDVAVPTTLTIIDYSKPSTAKRLWV